MTPIGTERVRHPGRACYPAARIPILSKLGFEFSSPNAPCLDEPRFLHQEGWEVDDVAGQIPDT